MTTSPGGTTTTTPAYNADGQTTALADTTTGSSPPAGPPALAAVTYNALGQVATARTAAGTSSYVYDADGNLIAEDGPAQHTVFADGGAEQLSCAAGGTTPSGIRYIPAPDGTQVAESSSGAITYEVTSQQGTATEAVSAATDAVTRRYYDPYGSPVGTTPGSWPDSNAYLGKPADPATGLDLLGARQYDPVTGSFLSLDPVFEAGSPLEMGGYTYAANDPVNGSDPTGLVCGPGVGEGCPGHGNPDPSPPPSGNGGGGGGGGGNGGDGGSGYTSTSTGSTGNGSGSGSGSGSGYDPTYTPLLSNDSAVAISRLSAALQGPSDLPTVSPGNVGAACTTVGVIGSGTLINYNPVLVDYTAGEPFLGQGSQAQSAGPDHPVSTSG